MLELLPDAILLLNSEGAVVAVNDRAQQLFSRPAADLVGLRIEALADPDQGDVRPFLSRCARSSAWLPGAFVLQRPDGSSVACRSWGARGEAAGLLYLRLAERGEDESLQRFGRLNQRVGDLSVEVARRKRAEAWLEHEKEILEAVASGSVLGDALAQLATIVEEYAGSDLFASFLVLDSDSGRLRHAAGPSLPASYIDAIDGLQVGPAVGSCGTAAFSGEVVAVTDVHSDPRWEDFRELADRAGFRACWSVPVFGERRQVLGTVAIYAGDPRAPEPEDLKLLNNAARLASVAITRHRQALERERLLDDARVGREAAEAANRAKDRFIAMLGHELRNPLAAMMNAVGVLAESRATEPPAKLLSIVQRQGSHLRRILEDLLDITRFDVGKLVLDEAPLRLDEVVEVCITDLLQVAGAQSMQLECESAPALINGDSTRIEQIVRNLIDNAIKYGIPGGTVKVSVAQVGSEVVLRVVDDGVGIDAELLPTVFEPFTQAPQSLSRRTGGVGLGLPLVQRLVEMHGGEVTIRSDGPGRGTCVEVRLPRLARSVDGAPGESPAASPIQSPESDRTGRILIVEDHEDSREGLRMLLTTWGYAVDVAADGKAGLDQILNSPPRVALIDIGLPEMNGYEVARAIRSSAATPATRLVAMTGYGTAADIEKALAAGFDAHLVKPATIDELRAVLSDV